MKKLLFALIAFTMLTTSCYKKDFENLNAKIDAQTASISSLATQVSSIATLVAGIPALQTSINTLTTTVNGMNTNLNALIATVGTMNTTVNTIKTSVDGLTTSLAALTATVNTINTNLNKLATDVAANQVTTVGLLNDLKNQATANQTALVNLINATKTSLENTINTGNTAVINALTTVINNAKAALDASIAASQAAVIANANTNTANIIAAINTSQAAVIAAIQVQINTLQANLTSVINSGNANVIATLQASITAAQNALAAAISAAQAAIIADNANQTAVLSALINSVAASLQAQLAIANAQLATLVNSNNIYLGDLIITNEAELVYAESLGAKVRAITGNVYIDATTFSGSQLTRLKNVTNNTLVLPAPQANPFIGTVVGNVDIRGTNAIDVSKLITVSGNVWVNGAGHNLSSLISVTGDYTVGNLGTAQDPSDDMLQTVGGNMWVKHFNGYSYPNLTTVGGVLTAYNLASTNIIYFPALTSNTNMNDGDGGPNGDLTYNNALSVNIGASSGMYSLVANSATTITLGEDVYTGGSVYVGSTSALTINMSNMTGANGPLTINTPNAGVVDLTNLATLSTGAINITTDNSPAGTVLLPNYTGSGNNNTVTINGPVTQDMPKFAGSLANQDIFSTTIITITLAKYQMGGDLNGLAVAENITVGDVKNDVNTTNLNEGPLKHIWITASSYSVNVYFNTTFDNLLTVSTAGLLHGLKDDGNNVLTTITTAGQMDKLEVWHNPALTSIAMGHNFYNNVVGEGTYIDIWDNDALTSLTTSTGRMKFLWVGGNAVLSSVNFSSFVAGDNITAGSVTAFVYDNALEGTYTPSVFVTNTPPVMVQSGLSTLKAYMLNLYSNPAYTVSILFGYNVGAGTTDNITGVLDTDRANHILAGGSGATTFVQRDGDAGGAIGSRINVARELGYLQ